MYIYVYILYEHYPLIFEQPPNTHSPYLMGIFQPTGLNHKHPDSSVVWTPPLMPNKM